MEGGLKNMKKREEGEPEPSSLFIPKRQLDILSLSFPIKSNKFNSMKFQSILWNGKCG